MTPQRPNPFPDRVPPLDELVNVFEVEEVARRRLDRVVYDHVAAGVAAETTLHRNRAAFDRMTFRRRVLTDVTRLDLSTELLGLKLYAPILVGPTANHGRLHPEGELATVAGAGAARTLVVVSQGASRPIDRIAAQASAPLWYQVYPEPDETILRDRVQGAVAAGVKAVVVTFGAPYEPLREVALRNRLVPAGDPLRRRYHASPRWDLLKRLRDLAKVPVLAKGILSPDDAAQAAENGAAGIIVSNHGGRFVDGVPATIETLPKLVDAAGASVPVLIDSGFRRGTDILKALALGAKAVLLGRPILWGLAAYGADGVRAVLEMLHTELALAMGLCGKPNLAALDRTLIRIHRR